MSVKPFAAICCLLLCFASAASGQCKKSASIETVPSEKSVRLPDLWDSKDECTLFKMIVDDTVLGYSSGYQTDDRTVCYYDPAECGATPYPYEVNSLSFVLLDPFDVWDPREYKWPVELDVVLFDAYDPVDSCLGPGTELCRISVTCDSASFAYPEAGTVTFSTPCCVDGPFFIGIEYTDAYTGLLPSIMFDYNSTPDTCHLFQYICDSVWVGWYAYWVTPPGYPFFWVNGETVSMNCCDDTDSDGLCDEFDNCPLVANPDQADVDDDGTGDLCDDDDADGIIDINDNCPGLWNPWQEDNDGDGIGNHCEDSDGDGVNDWPDNCWSVPNSDQLDSDGDDLGDLCDNCPFVENRNQADFDNDGEGDACDNDVDGDTVNNDVDNCPWTYNPGQEDSDTDGEGDACECVGTTGNVDCDPLDEVTMGDLTVLIDHLFISLTPVCNEDEANVDLAPGITMGDLTVLIDHLFISLDPLPACP